MLNEILKTLQNNIDNKLENKVPNKLLKEHQGFSDMTWKILSYIIDNPCATSNEMSSVLGVGDRMIRNHIKTLRDTGIIQRVGSNKNGRWEILK